MVLLKKKILGVPAIFSLVVAGLCVIGIIVGSFCDYQINRGLANITKIGTFFANYGLPLSYCLYPAAGMCFYKALIKKGKQFKFLAWILLVVSYVLAVYYANNYCGGKLRDAFGYKAGESSGWLSVCAYLVWIVFYSWVPVVFYFLLDDVNPTKLIVVGAVILVAGVCSDLINVWLKQLASRPRYKYLIKLEDPLSEYKNWWEWNLYKAGSNDNFKSWPSGNMTISCYMFTLPMLFECFKKRNNVLTYCAFSFAFVYVSLFAYNRIHMTAHFLSDVCFGSLITLAIFVVFDLAFNGVLQKNNKELQ